MNTSSQIGNRMQPYVPGHYQTGRFPPPPTQQTPPTIPLNFPAPDRVFPVEAPGFGPPIENWRGGGYRPWAQGRSLMDQYRQLHFRPPVQFGCPPPPFSPHKRPRHPEGRRVWRDNGKRQYKHYHSQGGGSWNEFDDVYYDKSMFEDPWKDLLLPEGETVEKRAPAEPKEDHAIGAQLDSPTVDDCSSTSKPHQQLCDRNDQSLET